MGTLITYAKLNYEIRRKKTRKPEGTRVQGRFIGDNLRTPDMSR